MPERRFRSRDDHQRRRRELGRRSGGETSGRDRSASGRQARTSPADPFCSARGPEVAGSGNAAPVRSLHRRKRNSEAQVRCLGRRVADADENFESLSFNFTSLPAPTVQSSHDLMGGLMWRMRKTLD